MAYSNPCIAILAGGLATRLHPITKTTPKALVEVKNQPFAFHQLRLLKENGFSRAVFLIGHMGEQIVEAIGGETFNIEIGYAKDGPILLGTGGAIAQALPQLTDPFCVIYGDSWLDFDYQAAIAKFELDNRKALMTVFNNERGRERSNVEMLDGDIHLYSKSSPNIRMTYIDYGFSIFRKSAFEGVSTSHATDLAVLFESLARKGELSSFEVTERYFEVGSFEGCGELEKHFDSIF
jgi:N-acetyl-alpha-D-muramate 1-phosphate uridylyltransferase